MLKDEVYKAIKQQILVGRYMPGDLLNERALMEEYKIGKSPLREIFFRLQHDGLIRRFPRVGTIVAPINTKKLNDVAEMRFYFEGIVARLAVKRISDTMLAEMGASLQKMEDAVKDGNISVAAAEEAGLHSMLYAATGNAALKEFIEGMYDDLFTRMWFTVERTPMNLAEQLDHWKAIYQALCEKDEEKAVASNMEHFAAYFNHLKSMK